MPPDDNECSSINLEKIDVATIPKPKLTRSVAGTFSPKDLQVVKMIKTYLMNYFYPNQIITFVY